MADKVFLTGSSGFVGAHVLRELLSAGYEVRALLRHREVSNDRDAIRHREVSNDRERMRAAPSVLEGRVEYITGDLANVGAFAKALDGCRYVVHCAALYSF